MENSIFTVEFSLVVHWRCTALMGSTGKRAARQYWLGLQRQGKTGHGTAVEVLNGLDGQGEERPGSLGESSKGKPTPAKEWQERRG